MAVMLQQEDDDTFTKRIMPELERVEAMRRTKADEAAKRMKIAVIGGLGAFAAIFALYACIGGDIQLYFFLGIMVAAAFGLWQDQPRQQYEREYKEKVMPQVARLLGLSSYSATGGMTVRELHPAKIIPSHDISKTEDYFEGNYKGALLRFCEMHLQKSEGTGKNRRTVTVFKGLAIVVKLPKRKFYGQTILVRDTGGFVEWFKEKELDLKRADLVDPVFEKQYTVYTNDQVEARYLIDPAMMERIQKISDIFAAKGMSMSYYGDSQVLSLIDCSRNRFEPPNIYVPATNMEAVMNLKRELTELLNFLDFLELYRPVDPQSQPNANQGALT